jgi:antagonist of KipI
MPVIVIQSAGLLTTVQDSGRFGYQRYGMPAGGAMDPFSFLLANALVGNRPDAACLETTYSGPEIVFTADGAIAITGADMRPCKNGKAIQVNKTIFVKSGDILSFRDLKYGCRSYIAFAGGILVPRVMGSYSTYLRAKIGGFEGRALRTGDELNIGAISGKVMKLEIPETLLPEYGTCQTIRIIPGPEIKRFDFDAIRYFLTSEYLVTDQSDRMGYRLSGYTINSSSGNSDIISAGISLGTIQIPGNGQPIILMADRPTSGGYNRIANVISSDITLLAQLKPGDYINFNEISVEKAQELLISRQKLMNVDHWHRI